MIDLLHKLVVKDLWLKLFSLALAVLTWATVNIAVRNQVLPGTSLSLSLPVQKVFPGLPVVIMSSAEDVRSFRVNPKEVDVTLQGDPQALKALQKKDIHVLVDLTGIQAAHDLRKRIEVSTPVGVTYVKVDPDQVQVIFPPKI